MKYVLFHSDGVHIGTLQTEEVGEYLVPFIVVDAIPDIMMNVPANKIVMINEKDNSVYLADRPKTVIETEDDRVSRLELAMAELSIAIAANAAGKDAGTPSATPTPAATPKQ